MKLKTNTPKFRCARLGISLATTALAAITLSAASAQDNTWTGGTDTDWNTPGNWSLTNVPTGQGAIVDNASGNIATISSNITATPTDIYVRNGSRIDHLAGNAGTGAGNYMWVENGTYNLADTASVGGGISGYAQGAGSLSANANLLVGAWGDNRNGTINVNTTGIFAVAGELFFGDSTGSQGTLNLESGTMTVNNGIYVGKNNGTGTLNMSGGTLTKTGDRQTFVGDGGTGTVAQSGGSISINSGELYIGNGNTNASGTYTLGGTGALTVSNEVVVGRESGTGVLNVDGGTITTGGNGNMYIGRRNGTGTLNQSNGVIIVNKEFGVGTRDENKIGTGTYNLSGGSLSAANNIFIGKEQGSSGTMDMTGGTMSTSDKLQIGHNQATGVLTQSGGTINVQNEVYIGNASTNTSVGTYTLSGTGVLNVGNEVSVGRDNGTGTFNLDGGTVNATKISGGTGSATVNFNGGVLKAKRDEANLVENLDTANVDSGGIKIDSNGFNVATSQALSGTGGLEKSGAGSLTLNAASTYTGPTLVSAGTLKLELNSSITSAVTVEAGAALAGAGAIAGDLSFNSGAKFVFSLTQTLLANGATVSFADFGIDDLVGLSSATTVGLYNLIGGTAIINTNGLSNLGAANAADLGDGKSAYFTEGSLQVNVVPEPSTYALLVLAGLGLAGHVIRRRR